MKSRSTWACARRWASEYSGPEAGSARREDRRPPLELKWLAITKRVWPL